MSSCWWQKKQNLPPPEYCSRSTFTKVGAPTEGQDILLELAFNHHKLQAPDSWLSASVQAGLHCLFLVSCPKGFFKVLLLEIETKPLWRGWSRTSLILAAKVLFLINFFSQVMWPASNLFQILRRDFYCCQRVHETASVHLCACEQNNSKSY